MKSFFGKIWSGIKSVGGRIRTFVLKHKIASALIVLVLIGGGYYAYTTFAAGNSGSEYSLATVTNGPLQVTVTESGTVDSKDTLDVTPQGGASGQITYIGVTPGQTVTAGTLIARLDATTAAEAVTTARQNLESDEISYQQTLTSSQTSSVNDQTSVATDQNNESSDIASTFTNIAPVMQGLDTTLHNVSTIPNFNAQENIDAYDTLIATTQARTYHDQVVASYATALSSYQAALAAYTAADNSGNLTPAQTEQLAQTTLQATNDVDQALRDTLTYFNYINNQLTSARSTLSTQIPTQISTLTTYESTVSSDTQTLTDANTTLVNAQQTLAEDTQTLGDSGSVPLNVQAAQLSIAKDQEALTQAENTEADYDIVAPFDGTIATVPVNVAADASSGTTIATLITNQEYVDLSLNETDVASVQLGQPVSMTFAAIPNLTLTGKVAQIDPVGTVTSGVVTYDVQVSFDTPNAQVKPGMTVTAVITTASVASAIQIPSSAITTANGISSVEVATVSTSTLATYSTATAAGTHRTRTASSTSAYGANGPGGFTGAFTTSSSTGAFSTTSTTTPAFAGRAAITRTLTVPETAVTVKKVIITTGLSTATMTQVLSGLQPGEYVVASTISKATTTTKTAAASATSLLGGSTTGRGSYGGGGGFSGGGAAGSAGGGARGG